MVGLLVILERSSIDAVAQVKVLTVNYVPHAARPFLFFTGDTTNYIYIGQKRVNYFEGEF